MSGVKGVKHLAKASTEHNIYHVEDVVNDVENEMASERLNEALFGDTKSTTE